VIRFSERTSLLQAANLQWCVVGVFHAAGPPDGGTQMNDQEILIRSRLRSAERKYCSEPRQVPPEGGTTNYSPMPVPCNRQWPGGQREQPDQQSLARTDDAENQHPVEPLARGDRRLQAG